MKKTLIRQYSDGRWGFDDYSSGTRHMVRCKTKERALARAMNIDVFMANGRVDLLQSTASEWAEFRAWKSSCKVSFSVAEACKTFLALKGGKSSRHLESLTKDLTLFENFVGSARNLGEVTALDIQHFLDSRDGAGDRRKFNLRACVVTLFRWARRMSYLPDRTTEAEKVEPIEKRPGLANVLLPTQLQTLIDNVREEYLPWLCIGAFAGIRSEEIAPDRNSKKSPLAWEDFDWEHKVIIVRAQTSKTREEREVPIPENLAEWLGPWRNAKGSVIGEAEQPSRRETARIGRAIGGWQHNSLRDSFCSYRTRITQNVPQTSYEMGNSIAMVRRSYHRRQSIEAAQAWFDIRPRKDSNVIAFSKQQLA